MGDKLGCFGSILKLFGKVGDETYPYRLRDDFLSSTEKSFYHVLKDSVGNMYTICPKVSIKEFIFANCADRKIRNTYQNKINLKHVDFLLCDPSSMKPIIAIELDDSSHIRADRIQRDYFLNKVFEAANLRLVRFENKKFYKPSDIIDRLNSNSIPIENKTELINFDAQLPAVPDCPKCGIPMIKRIAHKGEKAGKEFYGCTNYPKCKETKELG
jgi:hypothetical protein